MLPLFWLGVLLWLSASYDDDTIDYTVPVEYPEPSFIWQRPKGVSYPTILTIEWSPDGEWLAIASAELEDFIRPINTQLHIYSPNKPDEPLTHFQDEPQTITSLAWRSSDQALFAGYVAGDERRFVHAWDVVTGDRVLSAPESGSGYRVAINSVDERVALTYGEQLMIFNQSEVESAQTNAQETDSDQPIRDFFAHSFQAGHQVSTSQLLWTVDGEYLITTRHPEALRSISRWSPDRPDEGVMVFEDSEKFVGVGFVDLSLSPDGRWMVGTINRYTRQWMAGVDYGDIWVWSMEDGKRVYRWEALDDIGVTGVTWSPDSRVLALGDRHGNLDLFAVDQNWGQFEHWYFGTDIQSLTWSSQNQLAVAFHYGSVMIFDMDWLDKTEWDVPVG